MAEPVQTAAEAFRFNAGWLCLDFANTVRFRPISDRLDLINDYSDLIAWAHQATIITAGEAEVLGRSANASPREAAAALARARALRESVYGLVSARAASLPPPPDHLHAFNRALARAMARAGLVPAGNRFEWGWPGTEPDLDRIGWWVARSAAELLTSPTLTFVRECAGYDCGGLFLDTTKNRSRRWCDMQTCGNRAKSRRHYERRRMAGSDRPPAAPDR